jgi:phosphate transport system permease protein
MDAATTLTLPRVMRRQPDPKNALKTQSGLGDVIFFNLTRFAALLTLFVLAGIIVSLVISSWPSIQKFGFSFITETTWDPPAEKFGALVPIYGTIVTSLIALVIAVPVSFGIALFLTELSPAWLRRPLGTAIELLAAIPSIVYGMWGLLVFSPIFASYIETPLGATLGKLPVIGKLFQGAPIGIGLLCAGIILAIMIIPFIASVMRDVFEVTPPLLKESVYGLGGTTWEVVWKIVLPYTRAGVIGGVMLGLGRALGETIAVTLIISPLYPPGKLVHILPTGGNSIASLIALQFGESSGLAVSALMAAGLVLFVMTLIVNAVASVIVSRSRSGSATEI